MSERQSPARPDRQDLAVANPRSNQPALTTQQRATMAKVQKEADIIRDLAFPAAMAGCIPLGSEIGSSAWKVYLDEFVRDTGDPTDPIERLMVQQLALAHHRIGQLHIRAESADSVEAAKQYAAAAVRLTGEFRRLALALRQYRQPVSTKHFTVVKQQNLSNGDQQIAYLDQPGEPSGQRQVPLDGESTEQASRRLAHAPADTLTPQSPPCGSRTSESEEAWPADRRRP